MNSANYYRHNEARILNTCIVHVEENKFDLTEQNRLYH